MDIGTNSAANLSAIALLPLPPQEAHTRTRQVAHTRTPQVASETPVAPHGAVPGPPPPRNATLFDSAVATAGQMVTAVQSEVAVMWTRGKEILDKPMKFLGPKPGCAFAEALAVGSGGLAQQALSAALDHAPIEQIGGYVVGSAFLLAGAASQVNAGINAGHDPFPLVVGTASGFLGSFGLGVLIDSGEGRLTTPGYGAVGAPTAVAIIASLDALRTAKEGGSRSRAVAAV
jgi:hypothetical protein